MIVRTARTCFALIWQEIGHVSHSFESPSKLWDTALLKRGPDQRAFDGSWADSPGHTALDNRRKLLKTPGTILRTFNTLYSVHTAIQVQDLFFHDHPLTIDTMKKKVEWAWSISRWRTNKPSKKSYQANRPWPWNYVYRHNRRVIKKATINPPKESREKMVRWNRWT